MEPNEAFVDALAEHVRTALDGIATAYRARGRSLEELGSPKDIAARMLATVPAPTDWDTIVGPLYTTTALCRVLGNVSRQAVADRRRRGTLFGLRTADGQWLYPIFQFTESGAVLAGLSDLLRHFDGGGVDDWTLAAWLRAPLEELGGNTVIEALHRGESLARLTALARAQAARYAA